MMTLKRHFSLMVLGFAMCLLLFTDDTVNAGFVPFGPYNRYIADNHGNYNTPTGFQVWARTFDATLQTNYLLWVGLRSWYLPGYNNGALYCKTSIYRWAYNTNNTNFIVSAPFNASYFVSAHHFDQTVFPGGTGLAFASQYDDNRWADYNYWENGNNAFPVSSCDSAPIIQ